jgi:hypothetical protein
MVRLLPSVQTAGPGELIRVAIEVTNTSTHRLRLPDPKFFTVVYETGDGVMTSFVCRLGAVPEALVLSPGKTIRIDQEGVMPKAQPGQTVHLYLRELPAVRAELRTVKPSRVTPNRRRDVA